MINADLSQLIVSYINNYQVDTIRDIVHGKWVFPEWKRAVNRLNLVKTLFQDEEDISYIQENHPDLYLVKFGDLDNKDKKTQLLESCKKNMEIADYCDWILFAKMTAVIENKDLSSMPESFEDEDDDAVYGDSGRDGYIYD